MPATIQDVYLQFDPLEPLEANDPRYVDCTEERGIPDLFEQLLLPLASDRPMSLLFSGHLGDGKTTILRQLQGQLETEGYFVAFGEADARLDLSDVESDDVLLAILAVTDQALRERYRQDTETGPFRQLWDDLSRIAQLPVELKEAEVSLGPFAKMTATVKDALDVRLQVRQHLRQARGPTFLEVVNEYIRRAQEVIKKYKPRRLVVVLDNLDRVQETELPGGVYLDERLFLGQATQLLGVQCHIIYTMRLALAHAQASNLQARYGQMPIIVPMIPVRRRDGTPHEEGMAKLRNIIERRIEKAGTDLNYAFSGSAVDRICRASGGYLRDLMTLVQRACAAGKRAHADLPLTEADVDTSIRNLGAQRRVVASGYKDALRDVAANHHLDNLPPDVRGALLRHRLVYEYFDGDYWYDISPLVA